MKFLELAFELFIIYIVYKLVFEFIIPIYNTTKVMKSKMTEMHERMQQQQNAGDNFTSTTTPPPQVNKSFNEDYIDYEEVK
ncbi:MAG: hypothetical protein JSU03_03045 [Bacteroidetes bacterium]|nr:hypothetical protein [Bacteroidota bacterium]MBS1756233.1 hypothetical protein [Bacteroidota bacterium]